MPARKSSAAIASPLPCSQKIGTPPCSKRSMLRWRCPEREIRNRPPRRRCYSFAPNADDLTARAQGPQGPQEEARDPRPQVGQGPQEARRRPAAARRLHACLHDHAEEAELRAAQGRPRAPDQLDGGHGVHPRRGPQPAGALRRARARRPRQGPAGRALQGRPRDARRRRRVGPQEGPQPVRSEGQVMPRRAAASIRPIEPDPVHRSKLVQHIINKVMLDGKKSTAERIVYDALAIIGERTGRDPVEYLEQSVKILTPQLEFRSRRVGGATYQVPVEVPARRARTLAVRWLIQFSRQRREKSMAQRLANELMDAQSQQGGAYKRKDDIFRMAQANKAFAHYRW